MTGRRDVGFVVDGRRCDAWLYESDDAHSAPRPVVVMGHGLGATKSMGLARYAERFSAAGYACLVFDYRHFGDSEGEPRELLSVRAQLADWEGAVAFARSLPGVDPDRVVVWGTSFGGGHVLTVAARDHRIAAAIAQCPFTDGIASTLAVPPVTSTRVTVAALRDLVRAVRGAAPLYLPNAAAPGEPAFMSSADALPGMRALGLADDRNRLTARSALEVLRYRPGRGASRIRCPLYVALCGPDTVAPSGPAARQVARAPHAEVTTYAVGHFDIYLGESFERAVAHYLEFLRRHVPAAAHASIPKD